MKKQLFFLLFSTVFALFALAMPSRNDLKKVQGVVNELMAEDMAAMKKGKIAPEKAAETAFGYAREATDEASKFLFYKGAFGLFVQGRRYDEAVKAIETLTREVKDVPDKVVADIVREKLKRVSKKDGGAVFELYDRIDRRVRSATERAKLEAALKANPKDAEARRQLALCKASLGDWAGALGDFALVGGKVAEAAKAEQGGKVAEAADLWWTVAEDDADQAVLREHAAGLYRQLIAGGKLTGIQLALAKKRAADFGAEVPAKPVPAESAAGEPPSAVAEGNADTPVDNGPPVVLDLGDGVKMTFAPCPAGEFEMGYANLPHGPARAGYAIHQVKISRPFWLATIMTSREQWAKMSKAKPAPGFHPGLTVDLVTYGDRTAPAVWIPFVDVMDACTVLTKRFQRQLPKGCVIRLPTEAEWEYASKCGGRDRLGDGDRLSPEQIEPYGVGVRRLAAAREKIWNKNDTHPVLHRRMIGCPGLAAGQYRPNAWGLYDLFGYLPQMVLDSGDSARCLSRSATPADFGCIDGVVDPLLWHYGTNPSGGVTQVLRGGNGWVSEDMSVRLNCKLLASLAMRNQGVLYGFRLAIGPDLLREKNLKLPKR